MTALNPATDIPSSVNTVEKLAYWAVSALNQMYPTLQATEGVGYTERVAQASTVYVLAASKWRFLGRASLEMSPLSQVGGAKAWTFVQELGNTALPVEFKSN